MIWLVALALVTGCFGFVLVFGAPYLPTLKQQIDVAFELAELKPGQTLLELGCGDGRVLIAAAKQGLNAVGYELNPFLAFIAWARTRRYGRQVKVICGNFWTKDWPLAEGIFTFLLPKYMAKLDKKVIQLKHRPVKLVSFAFTVPDKQPAIHKAGIYVYEYK